MFSKIRDELKKVWTDSSVPARAGFIGVAVMLLVAVVGVGIWSSRPEYVPLAANLSPADAAEIVSKLDGEGISNQLNFSGSTVLVDKSQWNKARLIAGDAAVPAGSAAIEFTDSLLSDPTLNHFRMLRNREQTLEQTITRLASVKGATVHIGQPEPSPFIQDQQATTASVVLELRPNALFAREQAMSIVAMVANSVQGLKTENITVMDTTGRLLTSTSVGGGAGIAGQYEFRRLLETDLAAKAESMLSDVLGPGKAVVRVTTDLDFTESVRTETKFDPDGKVKKSETINSTTTSGTSSKPVGPAGVASNVGNVANSPTQGSSEKTEDLTTEYENSKVENTVTEAGGTIKRLTVAATVDLTPRTGDGTTPAAAVLTKADIESMIKQAVGFDETRSDQIVVAVSQLAGIELPLIPMIPAGPGWTDQLKNISLGVAALASLVMALLLIKKMQPMVMSSGQSESQSTTSKTEILGDVLMNARQHPEIAAKIIATWMGEKQQQDEQPAEVKTTSEVRQRRAA